MKHCRFRISDFGFKIPYLDSNSQFAIRNPQLKGFTLFEVMVAVVIMATVLVSLIGLNNRAMQDVLLAEHITTATLLAKNKMIESIPPIKTPQIGEEEGDFPSQDQYKDYTWKRTVSKIPLPGSTATIMEVRISILWKEGMRQEQVELVSYE
jgi:general secretion pathway protein I